MKKIMIISILLITQNTFAVNETNFVGKFVATKHHDCHQGTTYDVTYNGKKNVLEIQVNAYEKITQMTIHTRSDTRYWLNKETNTLEIKRSGVIWDYKDAQRASKDSQIYYENSKYVRFDPKDKGNGEQTGYSYQELSLSKDKKNLTYYFEEGDGENDPHQYICTLERASQ
jgi:hypothetical protein